MRGRIATLTLLLIAAAGCDDGISPTSVAWVWAGGQNTCATNYDRSLHCWGSSGGVGDGSMLDQDAPVKPVGNLRDVGFMSLIGSGPCAITGGHLLCWGLFSGGDGSIVGQESAATPTAQSVIADPITQVAGASASRCVLKVDGSVWCWGFDIAYSLGTGTGEDSTVPLPLKSLASGVTAIHATYALKEGTLWGWGPVIGVDTALAEPTVMLATDPASGAQMIGVDGAGNLTCALRSDSRVWCWTTIEPNALGLTVAEGPAEIDVGSRSPAVVEIAVGALGLCRLDQVGAVQCAGQNGHGQLGDGTTTDRSTMAPVAGLPGPAIHIAAGDEHVCALLEDRSLWCWGANDRGQLGVGDTADRVGPTRVRF
jgi:alpha-tubulin suppressor-like RCC1 family protein